MASGDTKTEAMLNVLGNGGSGDEFRGCCNTKTQSYILDAIDRINAIQPGGTSDFNELENRPQLNGSAMTGNTNITNFTGTDGTNAGAQGLVPAPAAADADKFLKSDGTWATAGGGGGGNTNFRVLTDDDLVNNSYRLYELPSGAYIVPKTSPNHTAYVSMSYDYWADDQLAIVSRGESEIQVLFLSNSSIYGAVFVECNLYGAEISRTKLATKREVDAIAGELIDAWSTKDWPQTNPDGIALWKIDLSNNSGKFYLTSNNNVKLYITPSHSITGNIGGEIRRVRTGGATNKTLVCFDLGVWDPANNDDMYGIKGYGVVDANNDVELDYKIYATTTANSQNNANQSSSSSEDPGMFEPDPGVIASTVTCPFCGQQTSADSTICQFCGNDISGGAMPDPGEGPSPEIPPEEPTEEPVEG